MVSFKYCRFERENDHLQIILTNMHIICRSGELNLELSYLISRYSARNVSIDFSQVVYFSREAINDLLIARRSVLARGGAMQIRGMQPSVFTKFRSLRLDGRVFDIRFDEPFEKGESTDAPSYQSTPDVLGNQNDNVSSAENPPIPCCTTS